MMKLKGWFARIRFMRWLSGVFLAMTVALCVSTITGVYADGIPSGNALTYSGYLETTEGIPVDGVKNIMLEVLNAETDGEKLCEVIREETEIVGGHFQVQLPDACTEAVGISGDLWLAVRVDGSLIGQTKLGAVPYAVEAGHALRAETAAIAESAVTAESANTCATAENATNSESADLARAVSLHYDNLTASDDFGERCIADPQNDQIACTVGANRKCLALGYSAGWLVGESADGSLRSIVCLP